MNRYVLFIALTVGILPLICPKAAFGEASANEQNSGVSMTITKFQVNDQTLELGWKIINNSDHDVWICDGLHPGDITEIFLDPDAETLVIRRRFDLPMIYGVDTSKVLQGSYIRLRSGHEKVDSISLDVPIEPHRSFGQSLGNAENAVRVALEIGFYDEDLPGMILQIVEVAEKINCDLGVSSLGIQKISDRFFGGWAVAKIFKYNDFFRESVTSGGDEVRIPYMGQVLHGEQVLRLVINDVLIPYRSNYPPLTDEPTQSETEPAGVTMALTDFDVNDTNLELSWKIINNTDHDVWICESMSRDYPPPLFEQFLDEDAKTLVIRKLFDLPMSWYEYPPIGGRYVRLRPSEEKAESVFAALPVRPYRMTVANKVTNAEYAERLALEIGYYDEDLPALILEIVEKSEHLNIDFSVGYHGFSKGVRDRFFGGPIVALLFKGMLDFEPSVRSADADGEMWMPDLDGIRMGEKILRIEIEGVSIPYKNN